MVRAPKGIKILNPNDPRFNKHKEKAEAADKKYQFEQKVEEAKLLKKPIPEKPKQITDGASSSKSAKNEPEMRINRIATPSASMFFSYNQALGPPYHILLDTNFINFSVQNKMDVVRSSMDCLFAKCVPCVTDCVMGELEKLGIKYRVALRVAKDPRFQRIKCTHKGTYADDCLVNRISVHQCFIVATCDKDLRRRIRKVPGVPIMYIQNHKYVIERMPEGLH